MKKLLIAICMLFVSIGFAQAQSADKAPVQQKPAKVVKMDKGHTKADGTPDKRFKENKGTAAPVAGPKKADGTADMRYKANKGKAKPAVKKAA